MNDNGVALAAIGLAGTTVTGIIWVVRYFAKTLSKDLREHTKAAVRQAQASKEQVKASKEVLEFMKNLNGKLANITHQTIQEQNVTHQTIEHEEKK